MMRAIITACGPWLAALGLAFFAAYLLLRAGGSRPDLRRIFHLHRDQSGSAQTLSFVLALPPFIWVLMLIVQISQIMIGMIVVHYAAFAAVRSAIVWIPAGLDEFEGPNRISIYYPDPEAEDQTPPIMDMTHPQFGPAEGGMTYFIMPGSPKYEKIASAAVLACMPLSPSRDYGYCLPIHGAAAAETIKSLYRSMAPGSTANAAIPRRLENKLAYASVHTVVETRFYHSNHDPPLMTYYLQDDPGEFYFNEIGYRDPITVTVRYEMALLPGMGRLLSNVEHVRQKGPVYVRELTASATLANEGEKLMIPQKCSCLD